MLTEENYHQLLSCTRVRNHMIEELHILLVQTEVELHHILRLIEDNLDSSGRNQDPPLLHGSLIDLLQRIRAIRRQYYIAMMEQNSILVQNYNPFTNADCRTETGHHISYRHAHEAVLYFSHRDTLFAHCYHLTTSN